MRNVIFGINMTLDGCCDHTKSNGNEEVHAYFTNLMRDVDLIVYGRKTYQLMVPYWPDYARSHVGEVSTTNDFAQTFNSIDKIVFSHTLESTDEKNTRILRTKPEDEIPKLKREQGRNISVGGVDFPSQLIKLGLVDEFHFVIHPIIAGEGRRLLDGTNLQEQLQLKLVESKVFTSGHVALHFLKP